jgi:hypothetical protein
MVGRVPGSMPKEKETVEDAQPGRLWTVPEANTRLETLRELLPQLRAWVTRLRTIYEELRRLADFWGKEFAASDIPDAELKARLEEEWQTLTKRLEREVDALQAEGIEVKDLESGLVDFYGLKDGTVVYLCWQRGEDSVRFYHSLSGGYRNRRPLSEASPSPTAKAQGST